MSDSTRAWRLGFDYRAALHNREGIGRAQRASIAALKQHLEEVAPEVALKLYASTLALPRVPAKERLGPGDVAAYFAARRPAKWAYLGTRLSGGVARALGGLDLFHGLAHQPLWPGRARFTATLFDLLFLEGPGLYLSREAAQRMHRGVERTLARAERLAVPSRHVAREVTQRLGFPAERIDLVPLGGDSFSALVARETPLPAGRFVLTVGRIDPRKNLVRGLEAFERLAAKERDLRWLLVGPPGFAFEPIVERLESSRFAERIEWRRAVGDGELKTLYQRCSAFFFPSLAEGFGLPPLEARFLGAPVAASNRTSLPELLGEPGSHLADPEDPAALASALEAALAADRQGLQPVLGPTWASGAALQWQALLRALG